MRNEHDTTLFLAEDVSCNENLILGDEVDGVNAYMHVSGATVKAISGFALPCPTVYLPTYDPEFGARLESRRRLGDGLGPHPRMDLGLRQK